MRAVIQRVVNAGVNIGGEEKASIGAGLLVLLGIEAVDDASDIAWLSTKIVQLRIFNDNAGVMNLSVIDKQGDILLVSQFTLHASTKKGHRPSYIRAAKPTEANQLYEQMITQLSTDLGKPVSTGTFQADMQVSLVNDGPVTIIIDSRNRE